MRESILMTKLHLFHHQRSSGSFHIKKNSLSNVAQKPAHLYGLVLSGGKSERMGKDKGLIKYHKVPQREHLYRLLDQLCEMTFLSVRPSQYSNIPKGARAIVDQNRYNGPFNGIMSAHNTHKNAAWLVLACDLPFMDLATLQQLINVRDQKKSATAFLGPKTEKPEPLACIWEPGGLEKAVHFLKKAEQSGPRKFLMDSEITLVTPKNEQALFNANTDLDYTYAKDMLRG